MSKLLLKIFLIGIIMGIVMTGISMLFGFAVYYAVSSIAVFTSARFLVYLAWISLAIGIFCTMAWYTYVAFVARQFFVDLMVKFIASLNTLDKKK